MFNARSLTPTGVLAPVDAANTAAATSGYVDVRGYEGNIAVLLYTGILDDGDVTYTFDTATSGAGAGTAPVTPISGAPTVISTSNDPNAQLAIFDTTQLKGFLRVTGTKSAAGGVLVAYAVLGVKKYAS